jgi:hypothetical protein
MNLSYKDVRRQSAPKDGIWVIRIRAGPGGAVKKETNNECRGLFN